VDVVDQEDEVDRAIRKQSLLDHIHPPSGAPVNRSVDPQWFTRYNRQVPKPVCRGAFE